MIRYYLALLKPLPDAEILRAAIARFSAMKGNWAQGLEIRGVRVKLLDTDSTVARIVAALAATGEAEKLKFPRMCVLSGAGDVHEVGVTLVDLVGGAVLDEKMTLVHCSTTPEIPKPKRGERVIDTSNRKVLITPTRHIALSADESICLSWIAFRTHGYELPDGSDTSALGTLVEGGQLRGLQLKTIAAARTLWAGRANEPLAMHSIWSKTHSQNAEAVTEMLDRQGVTYEDRRTQASLSAVYRKGRKLAENNGSAFVLKSGEPIALSTLGEVAAMTSLLSEVEAAIEECVAVGAPLRVVRQG